jgi:tetratricopeptide (TPR) repeat protein
MVLTGLEEYTREKLVGDMGAEFVVIIDDIARYQLFVGQYAEAERSYQTALTVWIQNVYYDPAIVRRRSGAIYHQLGRVAQEQEKWDQAKVYFLKDLEISREYNDLKGMTKTLRSLHRLWKKSGDPDVPENIAEVLGWTIKKIEK